MKVLWIGMDDSEGCVLNFHELRLELQDAHGVELVGPGYSWPYTIPRTTVNLSSIIEVHGTPDWLVFDDSNAMGYPQVRIDIRPDCLVAWRENDYHNRKRQISARKMQPDLILGATDRDQGNKWLDPWRAAADWRLVPFAVNTQRFHKDGNRRYNIGLYGKTGNHYKSRSEAKRQLALRRLEKRDVWLGTHGGYWRDGRGSYPEEGTYYNKELAAVLRRCRCLWVDGSDFNIFLQKYHEGAASGCVLVGERPYQWEDYYPHDALVECKPEEVNEVVDACIANESWAERVAYSAWEHCQKHHSIQARARQIVQTLELELHARSYA